ncbi:MAG: Na+/H+ antiporter NhaA [Acidimicrobiia bacterium]|nr:Na+/H+ antiporter NhaA [Acidimicrobiia bacterium]
MSVSQLEWLEHELHGWSSFAIVPVVALANAGVTLSSDALGGAAASALTLGVVVGLVAGKTIGISVAAWLATRAGIADLADGVSWRQVMGAAALGGIGFTVSLFTPAWPSTTPRSSTRPRSASSPPRSPPPHSAPCCFAAVPRTVTKRRRRAQRRTARATISRRPMPESRSAPTVPAATVRTRSGRAPGPVDPSAAVHRNHQHRRLVLADVVLLSGRPYWAAWGSSPSACGDCSSTPTRPWPPTARLGPAPAAVQRRPRLRARAVRARRRFVRRTRRAGPAPCSHPGWADRQRRRRPVRIPVRAALRRQRRQPVDPAPGPTGAGC